MTEEAKPVPVPETTTELTFDELLDSVTGYDEIAIKAAAQVPLSTLLTTDAMQAMRAVIAVHQLRDTGAEMGPKAYYAQYKLAQEMPTKAVRTYFAEPAKDPIPDEPDSPAGKDDSSSEEKTKTSPPSA